MDTTHDVGRHEGLSTWTSSFIRNDTRCNNTCTETEIKQDVTDSSSKTPENLEFEDPPPYKEKESPRDTVSSFQFLFPLITRPWERFFSLCWRDQWSISAENFGHNMSYYQMNYTWLLIVLVVVSLVLIDSAELNFCVLWTCVTVLLIYALNIFGCCPIKLLGRKLTLSEQLTALIMFELPFYGLLPGAVPFIFYILAPFACFVMVHACLTPVNKGVAGIAEIHHI
ncbi:hypothetical protein ACROYT_G026684 [Oculina patagonica]